MTSTVPAFCGKDCGGDACPLLAIVEDGRVVGMRRNPAAPSILPCPRGYALHEAHASPDRVLTPLIASGPRGSGLFRKAGWDEALGLVASRLGELRAKRGAASVMALGDSGSTGALHATGQLLDRFFDSIGGATRRSSNYSNGAARFVLPYLYGDAAARSGWDPATARKSRLIVLWGANVLEARLGSELGSRVAEAARSGVPVVVIDPRRSRTAAALKARWIPILPGTDAAMMLAVLFVLFREGLADRGRADSLSEGMPDIEAYVTGALDGVERSPAWAESRTGVPATVIEGFAREYAAARPAMLLPGYSVQRVRAGEEPYRLLAALQIATGNFGVPGGSTGSLSNRLPPPRLGSFPPLPRGDSPSVPILRWPDAILEGRRGGYPSDVRAAFIAGCNPLGQGADCRKSARALLSLEFSVCAELFLTPSARLCDVVLPAASPLEKADIGVPWAGNYLLYKKKAVEPRGLARDDYALLGELSERMGGGDAFTQGLSAEKWLDRFMDDSDIADKRAFMDSGVFIGDDNERVGLADFAADPVGHPLPTPSGKVDLSSRAYARDTGRPPIPAWTDEAGTDPRWPLRLVTPKTIRRTHSQGGGAPGPDTGELTMSAADAAALGLSPGDAVVVENASGRLRARLAVSEDIMPGVVCLHEGAWYEAGPGGGTAAGSPNVLTSTDGSGPAVAPVMHGVPVAVGKAADQG